ncbi:LPS translocon maturation chaperone LptM [Alloalcanivorax sp. C16-2]|uniref:LPS translocon maturation chaperone LptM n=1 Tax=Alloalcanivorax sp. C16-2 TaxID=3390052 RepID=UPI003970EDC5
MRAFGVVMITALLAGCGQKGPLYFAPQEPARAAPPAQDTPAATSDDEDADGKQDDDSEQN